MSQNYNIFRIEKNNILPEKGRVLISEPFLDDKYFGRSVVFLVEHNDINGTMGFVLNKPMKETMGDFFPDLKSIVDIPLFQGGPVAMNKLFFIHTLGDLIPGSHPVENGIYFDGDFNVVKSYINQGNPVEGKIKFFLGYSGWEQNQLDDEISRNSWLVSKLDDKGTMITEVESCWRKSLICMGGHYRSWANFPRKPFLN